MARRIVPFYVWPGFTQIWDGNRTRLDPGDAVVLNPASGAGDEPDPLWEQAGAALRERGVVTLGYVAAAWGQRRADECREEARRYRDWYAVDGIFWDEAPARGRFRTAWVAALQDPAFGLAVWNPGTGPIPRQWWKRTEPSVWLTFEGPASAYLDQLPVSDTPQREGHLVHSCHAEQEAAVLAHAHRQGVAWLHVTPAGTDGRPWEAPWWR